MSTLRQYCPKPQISDRARKNTNQPIASSGYVICFLFFVFCFQDLQDDMEDMLDQANEVQEALGRTYGMPEMDDADLDAGIVDLLFISGFLFVYFFGTFT